MEPQDASLMDSCYDEDLEYWVAVPKSCFLTRSPTIRREHSDNLCELRELREKVCVRTKSTKQKRDFQNECSNWALANKTLKLRFG
jgi:hypothetical protein